MNIDELQEKIASVVAEGERQKRSLKREYALANNPVQAGDIITDHCQTIKVETTRVRLADIPECVYEGPRLKRNHQPFKNGGRATVYQQNIKHIEGGES